ncbi:MAG: hypothetical protein WD119_00215 [Pirellulaceae bacterium]
MSVPTASCCPGFKKIALIALAACLPAAGYIAGRWHAVDRPPVSSDSASGLGWQLAAAGIDATASATGEKFSVATGAVGKSAEGLFILDHESGVLQCSVLYPRAGRFGGTFGINVKDVLPGGGKGGGYLMVTGLAEFPGGSNQPLGAGAVVYVLDTSTGGYACYGVPFNRVAETAGQPQQNNLVLVGAGQVRQTIDRDSLR